MMMKVMIANVGFRWPLFYTEPGLGWGGFTHGQAGKAQPEVDWRKSPKNVESPQNPPILENLKNHHRGFRLGWGRRQCFRLNSKMKISQIQHPGLMMEVALVEDNRRSLWEAKQGSYAGPHAMPEAANAEARNDKYSRDDQMFKPYWERAAHNVCIITTTRLVFLFYQEQMTSMFRPWLWR